MVEGLELDAVAAGANGIRSLRCSRGCEIRYARLVDTASQIKFLISTTGSDFWLFFKLSQVLFGNIYVTECRSPRNPFFFKSSLFSSSPFFQTCGLHLYSIEGLSYVPGVTLPGDSPRQVENFFLRNQVMIVL
ncbi:hypothetical protein PIB30_060397 [Stylosanthes scabra]|uniref:Uncharacterized protein n=1 Tax=Stylosanthes scabra TaxID=79078 RepID=A0ABU6XLW7_9FABA|nr:hypothetical protein [Stylosanthes scabra]